MSIPDRDKLKDLFARAIDLPASVRREFVISASKADPTLANEVLSLIEASESTRNLIEDNIFDLRNAVPPISADLTGSRFGNYRIVREIGYGGMGTVFLAERDDGEFSQLVALKLVRQSIADSRTIESFRRERQILAGLNHPNIAALYDGGISAKGEPFIAMEFVDGVPLNIYAAENDLGVEERLKLFLKVCSAVAYAHRNLVVHRDIKPSNILINAVGEPKLLDFGLAKVFESDISETQTAMRAFTPGYASPEQITGRTITTASDIYSLGVVLYELLTGTKPLNLDNIGFDEIVNTISTGQPDPPSIAAERAMRSSFGRLLRGDLDNIIMNALRKEPERRFRSVEEFANDIERHLEGRPVTARPNTFGYRASKFLLRHKIGVAMSALVLISIISGITFTLWQANVARKERDRAEHRFRDIRKLSNSLLFEIAPKIERLSGATDAREAVVTRALEYLDSLAAETADDPSLQAELAAAYEKVGDLQGNPLKPNLSDFAGAIESYIKARDIILKQSPNLENRAKLAANYRALASIRFAQNEVKESLADSERSLALFADLILEHPDDKGLAAARTATLLDYGHTLAINNQYSVGIPIYRDAINAAEKLDQEDPEILRLLALGRAYLGNALSWDDQQPDAEAETEKAIKIVEKLLLKYPNDANVRQSAWIVYSMASSTFEGIQNDISLRHAQASFKVAERSVELDPADTQALQNLAKAKSRLGNVLVLMKRREDGIARIRESLTMMTGLIQREPRNRVYQRDLGTIYTRLGDAEKSRSNLVGALAAYKESSAIYRDLAASDETNTVAHRDWAQAVKSVGITEKKLGRSDDARASISLAIEIFEKLRARGALGKWDEKIFNEMYPLLASINSGRK
ncbi:MAG: protein kinase [Acidobacteria bacterium]|nr:protein kinase [Acidobacteriota bacterium]MCW5949016.1 protein kinase [Pyrinomonadaceae bacterium]